VRRGGARSGDGRTTCRDLAEPLAAANLYASVISTIFSACRYPPACKIMDNHRLTWPMEAAERLVTQDPINQTPKPVRRPRRSQAEIIDRILAAAQRQFNEQGYAAATTKEIARQADVSETLLYRHFKSKAGLFDQVVYDPFDILATQLLGDRDNRNDWDIDPAKGRALLGQMVEFLAQNRRLLCDLAIKGLAETADERAEQRLDGMRRHYRIAASQVQAFHQSRGQDCPFDPDIAVRLSLGTLLAAILFNEWLFPDGMPPRDRLVENIRLMMVRALAPPAADPD
jgi:AcrR family transcriptional regulator